MLDIHLLTPGMEKIACTALQSPPASASPKAITEPSGFKNANAPLLEMIWTSPTSPWKPPPKRSVGKRRTPCNISFLTMKIKTMKKEDKMLKMKGSWCFSECLKMDIGYYFTKILFKSVGAYQLTGFHWNKKCFSCKVYLKIIKFALIIQLKLLQVNLWNFHGSPFQQNTPILNKSVQSYSVAHPSELPESPFPNHLVVDHPRSRQHHLPILQQTHSHWLQAVARCATGPTRPRPHHPRQRRPNRLVCHHPWALRRPSWLPQRVVPRFSEPKVAMIFNEMSWVLPPTKKRTVFLLVVQQVEEVYQILCLFWKKYFIHRAMGSLQVS